MPTTLPHEGKVTKAATDVWVHVVGPIVIGPIAIEEVKRAQADYAAVSKIAVEVKSGAAITDPAIAKTRSQLLVRGGTLIWSVKVSPNDIIEVPVLPPALEDAVLKASQANAGHGSWEIMYRFMQSRCYFLGMASKCVDVAVGCVGMPAPRVDQLPDLAVLSFRMVRGPWCKSTSLSWA